MSPGSGKKLIIGIDEAGYGPSLGPLLIGGSAWLVPHGLSDTQFSLCLSPQFAPSAWASGCSHVPLGDSKKLYRSGSGLGSLEYGLLAMVGLLKPPAGGTAEPANMVQLLQHLSPGSDDWSENLPWYDALAGLPVPASAASTADEVNRLNELARAALRALNIELLAVRTKIISEPEFNRQVQRFDSKGRLLSQASLQLVAALMECAPDVEIEVYCDRQGGRTNYLPMLLEWMPDSWFTEIQATVARCSYQAIAPQKLSLHFTIGGDAFAPTALASMAAKYVRERLMESINHFWSRHVSGLRPTAGYPADAKRYRSAIQAAAHAQCLPEHLWWRCR
ncbi:MAG: hypothetical protein KF752_04970 [Pirellulaceae bacterium]|nr:hypothetical protein [Pirellulaceae bacterium]